MALKPIVKPQGTSLRKKILVGVLVVAGSASLCFGAYYAWLMVPPGLPSTPQGAVALLKSARFQRLPDYRKAEYEAQAAKLIHELPADQRRKLFHDARTDPKMRQALMGMREQEMLQRALAYAKASPDDKVKMLDEDINRMEQRRAQWQQRRAQNGGNNPNARRGPTNNNTSRAQRIRQHMENHIQHGNPQTMALMHQYFTALRQRMQQRGITPPGGGRRFGH